jgi:hypothetical protein
VNAKAVIGCHDRKSRVGVLQMDPPDVWFRFRPLTLGANTDTNTRSFFRTLTLFSSSTMFNLSSRTAKAVRRLAAGFATAVPRIGDTKVPMSLLEKGVYINYQRIEDNLVVVRERSHLVSLNHALRCLGISHVFVVWAGLGYSDL